MLFNFIVNIRGIEWILLFSIIPFVFAIVITICVKIFKRLSK